MTFVGKVMSLLFYMLSAAAAKSLQSCPTLCDPIDGSPPGSPVPGILQARVLEWGATAFSISEAGWRVYEGEKRLHENSLNYIINQFIQFSSVTQSCPTLCDSMDCSTPGLPVHHKLLEFTQTHVHQVSDAIQLSPLLSPSPPTFNLSQHQDLFK